MWSPTPVGGRTRREGAAAAAQRAELSSLRLDPPTARPVSIPVTVKVTAFALPRPALPTVFPAQTPFHVARGKTLSEKEAFPAALCVFLLLSCPPASADAPFPVTAPPAQNLSGHTAQNPVLREDRDRQPLGRAQHLPRSPSLKAGWKRPDGRGGHAITGSRVLGGRRLHPGPLASAGHVGPLLFQKEMGQREAGENRRAVGSCAGPELTLTLGLDPAFFLRAKWDTPVAQVTHSETVLLLVQREGKEPGQDAVGAAAEEEAGGTGPDGEAASRPGKERPRRGPSERGRRDKRMCSPPGPTTSGQLVTLRGDGRRDSGRLSASGFPGLPSPWPRATDHSENVAHVSPIGDNRGLKGWGHCSAGARVLGPAVSRARPPGPRALSRGAEALQAPLGGSLAPGLLGTRGQVARSDPLGPCPEMPGASQLTRAWGWGPVSMPFRSPPAPRN
ncbi:hypothetical protein J1605_005735 [Eschrichtius robustus]|uniref:Collagen alpha-1(I) chain-like n=1 Tax=Eschrichtius robustus TaxID=9764 RepID=A0AB34H8T3_ESCRO|nr:hypothetical protein J1605_005735 [Eschrichtius robustus]